jgi:ribosome-associated protein
MQLPATAHSFDFAVLVTAGSDRLTNALVEEVWHFCKRHQVPRMPVEGESGWMLIDCYDVVVHALSEEKRAFYQLDTLWTLAKPINWAKEAKSLGDPDKPDYGTRAAAAKRASEVEADESEEEAETTAKPAKRAKKATAKPTAKAKPAVTSKAKAKTVVEDAADEAPAKPKRAKPAIEPAPAAPKKRKLAIRAKRQQGDV